MEISRSDVHEVQPAVSSVARRTHRFWEAAAVVGGAIITVHAVLSLATLDQTPLFVLLSWAELIVGIITVGIDLWFLTHV